jgi:hypothetical protein
MEYEPILDGFQLQVIVGGVPKILMHPAILFPESKNVYRPAVLIVKLSG